MQSAKYTVEATRFSGPASIAKGQPLPAGPAWLTWKPIGFQGEFYPHLIAADDDGLLIERRVSVGDLVFLDRQRSRHQVLAAAKFEALLQPFVELPAFPPPPPPLIARESGPAVPWPTNAPSPPWIAVELPYGDNRRLTKKFPNGEFGDILNDEERAIWASMQALVEETARLAQSNTAAAATSDSNSGNAVHSGSDGAPQQPRERRQNDR